MQGAILTMWTTLNYTLRVSSNLGFRRAEAKCQSGTSVGDPLEANAAGEFYARKDDHLIIGSVKGNIG